MTRVGSQRHRKKKPDYGLFSPKYGAVFQEYIVGWDRLVMMFWLIQSVLTIAHYVQDDQASELCPAYDIYKDKPLREVDLCPSSVDKGKEGHQLISVRQELRTALSVGTNSIRSFSPLLTDPASGTLSSFLDSEVPDEMHKPNTTKPEIGCWLWLFCLSTFGTDTVECFVRKRERIRPILDTDVNTLRTGDADLRF